MTSTELDIGAVEDFESGRPHQIKLAGRALVLVRHEDDFFVLRDTCPHQGGRLSAGQVGGVAQATEVGGPITQELEGLILRCPWHGWAYDITSGCSLIEPDNVRVRTLPARVEDGRVVVDVG